MKVKEKPKKKDLWRLFVILQAVPICLFAAAIFSFLLGVGVPYQAYGDGTALFMTDYQRNPDMVLNNFWDCMGHVVFFFFAGLPWTIIFLNDYAYGIEQPREAQ